MSPRILVICDYYLPGFKAGGPIRTLANIIDALGKDFLFHVITRDRDLGDAVPYPPHLRIESGNLGHATVSYIEPKNLTCFGIRQKIKDLAPDAIYLNSYFSLYFAIIPLILRRFRQVPLVPTILAPRGEFSPSALAIKSFKKRCYLLCAKLFRLCDQIIWQASGEHEAVDIRREFPHANIVIAPDLQPETKEVSLHFKKHKIPGQLKIVFLSRISPMKNLHGALQILSGIREGEVRFDIWGPIEDHAYWLQCQNELEEMPKNIMVNYRGTAQPEQVQKILSEYDVFLLPSLGENFGHVILEALGAGLPVIISDRTQWKDLARTKVGYDISLADIESFRHSITSFVEMDFQELSFWSYSAWQYANTFCDYEQLKDKTRGLFNLALKHKAKP